LERWPSPPRAYSLLLFRTDAELVTDRIGKYMAATRERS
jgi:hypothetical protein